MKLKTLLPILLCGGAVVAHGQTTAFTYQGRLAFNGAPANGSYDLRFIPFNASEGGTQAGPILTNSATAISDGLFTAVLDFGDVSFLGTNYWLEIATRTNGSGGFITLSPRQRITPVPQAMASATAITALRLAGVAENNSVGTNLYATVGGGFANTNAGFATTVGGGEFNFIGDGGYATIGGGYRNTITDGYGTIGGGAGNTVADDFATVAGGEGNISGDDYATTGGGYLNVNLGYAATVAGGSMNAISNNSYGSIGGGFRNVNTGYAGTVAGGYQNLISHDYATVGGGYRNRATNYIATVAGGYLNVAGAPYSAVGGGSENYATNDYATVPGGFRNAAGAAHSFAAGRNARANHTASFVWSGYPNAAPSFSTDRFHVLAANGLSVDYSTQRPDGGGERFFVIGPGYPNATLSVWNGAYLSDGGVWSNASDKNRKTDFAEVDAREILERVAALPVRQWRYTNENAGVRHLGPTAQDFQEAFSLGVDDKGIGTVDADGVALAAIQGLNRKLMEELKHRDSASAELKRALNELQQAVNSFKQQVKGGAQ